MANQGTYVLARREELIVGLTPGTAKAAVQIARAKSVWPVAIMCGALVLISGGILAAVFAGKMTGTIALAIAIMVAPASAATAWKILGKD